MINYTLSCNRLHLFKNCLCCFLDIHLYSSSLSTTATVSSLIILELIPACFSSSNNDKLSHNSLPLGGKKTVFETLEAETIKPGDLINFIRVRSQIDLLP